MERELERDCVCVCGREIVIMDVGQSEDRERGRETDIESQRRREEEAV